MEKSAEYEKGNGDLKKYVNSLSDDSMARWLALIVGQSFVAKKCGDDEKCITRYSNAMGKYIEDVWEDIKFFIENYKEGNDVDESLLDSTCRELSNILGMQN